MAAESQAEARPVDFPTSDRARILIVDDEAGVRTLLGKLLARGGYEVLLASDAEQAEGFLAAGGIDLVLTDKNLPKRSGIELLERIKASTPDLDVILMTAYPDMESVISALHGGAYDYLIKPFDSMDAIRHVVTRALDKRRLTLENRRLVKDLVDANERVSAMNRELEAKVAERTRQLEALTLTDDTTGLYNQRYLFSKLEEECSRANRYGRHLSVVMLDVDDFKQVNDTHDHLFGSRALRRLGEVLVDCVRTADSVVRYGGDEYTLILPETAVQAAAVVGERIRSRVEQANVGDDHDVYQVTVSIGIAGLEVGGTPESLLRAADRAAYGAKNAGKNCVVIAEASAPLAGDSED